MSPLLLLVHGWGFDASFWAPLQAALAPRETLAWDLGFFGEPACPPLPAGRPVVAVGHSFGLLWLAERFPAGWPALVSINGFSRFCAGPDFPVGIAPKLIERMIGRFAAAPETVYRDFMARFGVTAPPPPFLAQQRLADGLSGLRQWDARGRMVALALAGRNDPLLSVSMTEQCFAGTAIAWHEGGHLLPREDPQWCAERLGHLCDTLQETGPAGHRGSGNE